MEELSLGSGPRSAGPLATPERRSSVWSWSAMPTSSAATIMVERLASSVVTVAAESAKAIRARWSDHCCRSLLGQK